MGAGASTHPEYAFYVPAVRDAVLDERKKMAEEKELEKRMDSEMKARKMLEQVQKKHKSDVQRESAEETAKATATYFKKSTEHHRRLWRLHSSHGHGGDLFTAVAATARRASVQHESVNTGASKKDSPTQKSEKLSKILDAKDEKKDVEDKKEDNPPVTRHRRLSRLHSIDTHDDDLFASAVAATARRASVSADAVPDLNGGKTGITLPPINEGKETIKEVNTKGTHDAKAKDRRKTSTTSGFDEKAGSSATDLPKTQRHRRLSRLHSLPTHDEDLFACAVAATARRASVSVDSDRPTLKDEITTEKKHTKSIGRGRDKSTAKDASKSSLTPAEAKDKPTRHRRLSRLHSVHEKEDLFANAVMATARRASVAGTDGDKIKKIATEQKHMKPVDRSHTAKDPSKSSLTPSEAKDKPKRHHRLSRLHSVHEQEDLFANAVMATARRASVAGTDHVYVKNGDNIKMPSSSPMSEIPPIQEHMDEVITTRPASPPADPMAEQFNQIITSMKTIAIETGQDVANYSITLNYQQFLDVINEKKTLREALDETGAGVNIKITEDGSKDKKSALPDGRPESNGLDEAILPADGRPGERPESSTQVSGTITEDTVLNITRVTEDSDLVENLIRSVSQILAVPGSKASLVQELDQSSGLVSTSSTLTMQMMLKDEDLQEETLQEQNTVVKTESSDGTKSESALEEPSVETSEKKQEIEKEGSDEIVIAVEASSALPLPESLIQVDKEIEAPATATQNIQTGDATVGPGAGPMKALSEIQTDSNSKAEAHTESTSNIEDKAFSVILTEAVADAIPDAAENVLNDSNHEDQAKDVAEDHQDILPGSDNTASLEPTEAPVEAPIQTSPAVPTEAIESPDNSPSSHPVETSSGAPADTVDVPVTVSPYIHEEATSEHENIPPSVPVTSVDTDVPVKTSNISVKATDVPTKMTDIPAEAMDDNVKPDEASVDASVDVTSKEIVGDTQMKPSDIEGEVSTETQVVPASSDVIQHVQSEIRTDVLSSDVSADVATGAVAYVQSESSSTKAVESARSDLQPESVDIESQSGVAITVTSDSSAAPVMSVDITDPPAPNDNCMSETTIQWPEEPVVKKIRRLSEAEKAQKLAVPVTQIAEKSLENLLIDDIMSSRPDARLLVLPDLPTVIEQDTIKDDKTSDPASDPTSNMENVSANGNDAQSAANISEEGAKEVIVANEGVTPQVMIQENEYPLTDSQLNCVIGAYAGTKLSQKSIRNVRASICEGFVPESDLPPKEVLEDMESNEDDAPLLDKNCDNTLKPE